MKTTVYTRNLHTVTGSRQQAIQHFKDHGVALWFRACGKKAILFYRRGDSSAARTFAVDRAIHEDSAQGLLEAVASAVSADVLRDTERRRWDERSR